MTARTVKRSIPILGARKFARALLDEIETLEARCAERLDQLQELGALTVIEMEERKHALQRELEALIVRAERERREAADAPDRYGTIERGKAANLVILLEDPSQDIGALRSVVSVFKRGVEYPRSDF